MFNIGPGELIVIMIVALVVLGPDKLPEVARSIGKGMRELRRATEDIKTTVEQELYQADLQKPVSPAPPPVSPVAAPPPLPLLQGPLVRLPPASSETAQARNDLPPTAPVAAPEQAGVHPVAPPTSTKS
jgi:sec-independent protein translocase protein TatB